MIYDLTKTQLLKSNQFYIQNSTSLPHTEKYERGTGFGRNSEVLVNFYAPVSTNPSYHLVKKEHIWHWGAKQQAAFEKAKILVKLIKAFGISQVGLPFEDVSETPEGMGWALRQKQQKEGVPHFFPTNFLKDCLIPPL